MFAATTIPGYRKTLVLVCVSIGVIATFDTCGWTQESAANGAKEAAQKKSPELTAESLQQTRPSTTAQDGRNLIQNGSLEEPIRGRKLPFGWSEWPNNDKTYSRDVVDGGRTGKKCLRITGDGNHGVVFIGGGKLDRNKRYALKGWVKLEADGDAQANVKFNYFHNRKNLGLREAVSVTADQQGWQQLERTDRAEEVPIASWLWVSCTLSGEGTAWFDDLELVAYDRDEVQADFDSIHGRSNFPPEFHILNRRVGTWSTQTTIKPGPRFPDGNESHGEEIISWSLDKKVLLGRGTIEPGNAQNTSIWTFDSTHKVYRSWYFDSFGNHPRAPVTGTWNEALQTLTFRSSETEGDTHVSRMKFIGNDEMRWNGVWKDKNGKVVMEVVGKSIRKKSQNN